MGMATVVISVDGITDADLTSALDQWLTSCVLDHDLQDALDANGLDVTLHDPDQDYSITIKQGAPRPKARARR